MSQNAPHRGGISRGPSNPRGTPSQRGGQLASQGRSQAGIPAQHVTTIAVKRRAFGIAGRALRVWTNACEASIDGKMIYHYDVELSPQCSSKVNFVIIRALQAQNQVTFTPPVAYDGRKNMFSSHRLALGQEDSREFSVVIDPPRQDGRPPKAFKVRVTAVRSSSGGSSKVGGEINTQLLEHFVDGKVSGDNEILTAITALNVIVRMTPNLKYPFNSRSFFTDTEKLNLGRGLEVWRGYFQSVRSAIGKMIINVDISSGLFYKPGPLLDLCLEFLGARSPQDLVPGPQGLSDQRRIELQRFLSGLRIQYSATGARPDRSYTIQGLGRVSADREMFQLHDGATRSVAAYFQQLANGRPLRFPKVVCVKLGSRALVPIETCVVAKGQICKKEVPADIQDRFRSFSTMKPAERLNSIRDGVKMFEYGQSEYVRQFGIHVKTNTLPMAVDARMLQPPQIQYSRESKEATVMPKFGAWNMANRKLHTVTPIPRWVVVIFERPQRFSMIDAQKMVHDILQNCDAVGIPVRDRQPLIKHENPQSGVCDRLMNAGKECHQRTGEGPTLLFVVLPDSGNDIWRAVKFFSHAKMGVATQCVLASKAKRANAQYWANVLLKVNAKLGGVNHVLSPASVRELNDPKHPTIVMGADVMHPPPGQRSETLPSYASLVSSVNTSGTLYIANDSVQLGRQEIITKLKDMVKNAITMFSGRLGQVEKLPKQSTIPERIIFYRDGVGEGQFQQVLDNEVEMVKQACRELTIRPKITFIIVGKRHHFRFFPQDRDADRSGNCPPGTVIDNNITHPTDFDYYLQSHAGIIGTSRPAHYTVLYDDNAFTPDSIQALSFALCHVYARSTRSVSIPAPVYYADIVCTYMKTRFDPDSSFQPSEAGSSIGGDQGPGLQYYQNEIKPLHAIQSRRMFFQ